MMRLNMMQWEMPTLDFPSYDPHKKGLQSTVASAVHSFLRNPLVEAACALPQGEGASLRVTLMCPCGHSNLSLRSKQTPIALASGP
jgi:hypothetical protein